ncbi:unnamed protein product [Coffea canephora]|uniref:DH200=94 genomic scaffold, scaffold_4462 n=1 Tax=Coffea canephora TaxID=49390 RepID=A0A068VP47_COFCA|nr:unnamed protein product [Coffea canephora]
MAESVVGLLINQLSTLLSQEITLLGGLKSDVQFIKDELGSMKAFLREAEAKEDNNDSQLQEWLKQVREVAYDTEDVLDDFTFRFARGYMDGFCGKAGKIYNSIKNLKARHQISLKIKDIKARVREISKRHRRYRSQYGTQERGFSSSRQVNADFDIRVQSLFIEEAQLVGIDRPKAELISKILGDHSQLKVVSVAGMGGLGKTTLVKKVYDDAAVKKQFQSHAWITVSQNFQFRDIIKNLIQQLYNEIRRPVPRRVESMDDNMLIEFVRDFLRERRYILVLDDVNDCPPNLEEVVKKILKKCEGLPLAIVAIGDEWEMILHGFGGEADGSGKLDRIKRVLLLSYNDLPHYLKSCLLYLSIYPEDYPIDVVSILLNYMKELINRSLIQVKSTGIDGQLITCGLHDFVREIIVSKSKEQDFMTVATKYYTRWPEKVRHLAIHNFTDNPQEFSSLNGDPKLLKVLDLRGAKLDSIPKQVFKLFHLRYLNLARTGVKIIPKSIGKLQNLEVINLMRTNVTELPVEILNLRKLRCLCLVREVGKLTQLRGLAITKLRREDGQELLSSLLRLTNLRELVISCIKEDEILDLQHSVSPKLEFLTYLRLKGRLERVPQWLISLQSLRTLQLFNSRLREDENVIGSLGHLPNMVSLSLYGAYEGETLCFKVGGFQKLLRLELGQLKRLKWVRVEEESMPSLIDLQLIGCKLMQELPSGIQNLTRLQFLGFLDMSDELMHKVQNLDKQSEDYQTISHIPQVSIGRWIDGRWEDTFLL